MAIPPINFRDEILMRAPSWLRTGTAARILYSIGLHVDGFADALAAGVKSRFPGYYSPESLPFIGRERRMRRGLTETDAAYALRLRRWFDAHKRRGNPYELLRAIFAYYDPNAFVVQLVYRNARRFTMDAAGAVVMDEQVFNPGKPDATPEDWNRYWLFFSWPTTVYSSEGLWGDPGAWGDGGIWGSGFAPAVIQDLRMLVREWNAAHARGTIVLMPPSTDISGYPDEDDWDPVTGTVLLNRLEITV